MITSDLKRFFSEITDLIPLERKMVSIIVLIACLLNMGFYFFDDYKDQKSIQFTPVEALRNYDKSYEQSFGSSPNSNNKKNIEMFYFDPNKVNLSELISLGFSEKVAHIFLNYINKGGHFYKKEEVKKVYGVSEKLYKAIEPYIVIGNNLNMNSPKKRIEHNEINELDINRAMPSEYEKLKGIGKGFAYKICNFRDKLGGFVSVEQVGETYGLPDSVFQQIKPMLRIKNSSPKRLNLNEASVEELDAHPYIAKWQAEDIVNHRPIKDIDHLFTLKTFKKKEYNQRLIPYITF